MTNKDIKNAYVGTTRVKAMYLGSTKVWPVETLSRPQVGDFVYGDKTWSTELDDTKTCVGVITDVRSKDFDFVSLHSQEDLYSWTQSYGLISGVTAEEEETLAICDFAGKTNSQNIILAKPTERTAAHQCAAYSTEGFGAGSWFLPSVGQVNVAYLNGTKIDASLALVGGDKFATEYTHIWTSTQCSDVESWRVVMNFDDFVLNKIIKNSTGGVWPFCTYEYNPVPNGIYIYDKNNNRYTKEEWELSGKKTSDVCGIGISSDTNSFMININRLLWRLFSTNNTLINNVPYTTGVTVKITDRPSHGIVFTDAIISALGTDNAPAAEYAKSFTFKNRQKGYLPSFGEMYTLWGYKTQIEEILTMLGISSWNCVMVTSTQYKADEFLAFNWLDPSDHPIESRGTELRVLVFTLLPFKERII